MTTATPTQSAVQLKGSLFTFTVVQLLQTNAEAIANHLSELAAQQPNFFKNTPVVVDLKLLPEENDLDFRLLVRHLRQHRMIPVGVRNVTPFQIQQVIGLGLPLLPDRQESTAASLEEQAALASPEAATESAPATVEPAPAPEAKSVVPQARIIHQPVRSGQQIYAKGGDLIVLASVSCGAELLADGNIHVYGALRGRALAGVQGNLDARIFCTGTLEPEMLAIAGLYQLKDDLAIPENSTTPLQVYLEDERLQVGVI